MLSNLVRVVVGVVRTPSDLKSIENRSCRRRHDKPNGIAIAKIRMFPFSSFSSHVLWFRRTSFSVSSFSHPYGARGEKSKDSVRCTVSWPHFPRTRLRSVETNLALICPSPKSFICNIQILDHTQTGSLSLSFSLSQTHSVGKVRRESWERGWTPSS